MIYLIKIINPITILQADKELKTFEPTFFVHREKKSFANC